MATKTLDLHQTIIDELTRRPDLRGEDLVWGVDARTHVGRDAICDALVALLGNGTLQLTSGLRLAIV